jgi:hypothetical protein
MQTEFQVGIPFIGFGLVSIFAMSPENLAGKVVVVLMGIVFILVGALYMWMGFKRMENDE